MSNYNKYMRWQFRYSPLLTRFLYGMITLNTGAINWFFPPVRQGVDTGTSYFPVLMVIFGMLVILDSLIVFVFAYWRVKSLRKCCLFLGRWRHTLLLPCLYLYMLELKTVLEEGVPFIYFLAFASYSITLLLVGVLLVIQDSVVDNERLKR